jgi:hypothetical protein
MLDFLGRLHHFPGRAEDRFVALRLPELDVKGPVGETAFDKPGFPFWLRVVRFGVHHNSGTAEAVSAFKFSATRALTLGQKP